MAARRSVGVCSCRSSGALGLEIAAGKGPGRRAAALGDVATLAELGDEAGHLGAREAGDLAQVAPQAPLLGPPQAEVGEATQPGGDPLVLGSFPVFPAFAHQRLMLCAPCRRPRRDIQTGFLALIRPAAPSCLRYDGDVIVPLAEGYLVHTNALR